MASLKFLYYWREFNSSGCKYINDWLKPYNAVCTHNAEFDKIILFDTSEDLLAFKLIYG